jgi:hypothetical protein
VHHLALVAFESHQVKRRAKTITHTAHAKKAKEAKKGSLPAQGFGLCLQS